MSGRIEDLTAESINFRYMRIRSEVETGEKTHRELTARILGEEILSLSIEEIRRRIVAVDPLAGAGIMTRVNDNTVAFSGMSRTLNIPDKDISAERKEEIQELDELALRKKYPDENFWRFED